MISPKLRSVWKLSLREKSWLIPLLLVSAAARTALLLAPFRWVAQRLGTRHGIVPLSPLATDSQSALARRIGVIAAAVARRTPWQSRCLVQAIMVKTLLNHYRIPYALYLGVAKKGPVSAPIAHIDGAALAAHAWITVGSRIVSGAAGCNAFTVVSVFLSPLLQGPPYGEPLRKPGVESPRRVPAMASEP